MFKTATIDTRYLYNILVYLYLTIKYSTVENVSEEAWFPFKSGPQTECREIEKRIHLL